MCSKEIKIAEAFEQSSGMLTEVNMGIKQSIVSKVKMSACCSEDQRSRMQQLRPSAAK